VSLPRRTPLASLWGRWQYRLDHMPPGPERTILRGLLNEVSEVMADNLAAGIESIRAEERAIPAPPPESGTGACAECEHPAHAPLKCAHVFGQGYLCLCGWTRAASPDESEGER
jgi:hypothetical protein